MNDHNINKRINKAANGNSFWYSPEKDDSIVFSLPLVFGILNSPGFNLSGLQHPYISMSLAPYLRKGIDSSYIEYSFNKWRTATRLTDDGKGINWYNNFAKNAWTDSTKPYWHVASAAFPKKDSTILFRLRIIKSGTNSSYPFWTENLGFDDIHIYDLRFPVADSINTATGQQTIKGNTWVEITQQGKIIAAIHPQNQDLGNVNWTMYRDTGTGKILNGYKLLTRHWIIQANNTVVQPITLRLYFTDAEAEVLRVKNNCIACLDSISAYDFGVYQYTGLSSTVNTWLHDNVQQEYSLIKSQDFNLVPYGSGYYAEINTTTNREFYITTPERFTDPLVTFTAASAGSDKQVKVNWKITGGQEIARYEVEIARSDADYDAGTFITLHNRNATGASVQEYEFIDNDDKPLGNYYYRLKLVYKNGYTRYSSTQTVHIGETVLPVTVYPNPAPTGVFYLLLSPAGSTTELQLSNSLGQELVKKVVPPGSAVQKIAIDLSSSQYAQGVYLLKMKSGKQVKTIKLVKLN